MVAWGECALHNESDTQSGVPAFAAVADAVVVGGNVVSVCVRLCARWADLAASEPVLSQVFRPVVPKLDLMMKRPIAVNGLHLKICLTCAGACTPSAAGRVSRRTNDCGGAPCAYISALAVGLLANG